MRRHDGLFNQARISARFQHPLFDQLNAGFKPPTVFIGKEEAIPSGECLEGESDEIAVALFPDHIVVGQRNALMVPCGFKCQQHMAKALHGDRAAGRRRWRHTSVSSLPGPSQK